MLIIEDLHKSYGDVQALSGISFQIERGEVVALLGANGSGKTTTVESICKLLQWDRGEITLNGQSVAASNDYLRHVGAVLGGCRNTNWRLSAKQNARYFAALRGADGPEVTRRINELHHQLGLDPFEGKEVMKLSTGNKQKTALLCALAYSPDFVLLDEPTLGLDFTTTEALKEVIKSESQTQQTGFLVTSHDLDFVEDICDKVVVLDAGSLLFEGTSAQLKSRLFHYELCLPHNKVFNELTLSAFWQGRVAFQVKEATLHIQFDEPAQCLPTMAYLNSLNQPPEHLQITPLSIEKAYQTLVLEKRQ